MRTQNSYSRGHKASKKGVYNKYSYEKRLKLIKMVEEENRTLAASAKQLEICQTTARLILSTWREESRVFQKKIDHDKRMKKQAKKRATVHKRDRDQRKRREKQQGEQKKEGSMAPSLQKLPEMKENIQTQQVHAGIDGQERAENHQTQVQLSLHPSMLYQISPEGGMYWLCCLQYMPNPFGYL